MTTRFVALGLVSLTLLAAGFLALAAPAPFRGPLLVPVPAVASLAAQTSALGLPLLQQPIFLADLVGLALLALAVLQTWLVAFTWETMRRRHAAGRPRR